MRKRYQVFATIVLSSVLFLGSCQKEETAPEPTEAYASVRVNNSEKTITYYGPQVQMGDGKIRTFITISNEGIPVDHGVAMAKGAMEGLPSTPSSYTLKMHQKAVDLTPFEFVMVDWNPTGHEPEFLYKAPHFDFHFYMIGTGEQSAIITGDKMEKLPAPGYMPASYFPTPGGVPGMGKHWLDENAPELRGIPFTKTFIYGSYNGKVVFYEPMITREFLLSEKICTTPFPTPQLYAPNNTWYPSEYKVYRDEKTSEIVVSLAGFSWK
jgi:hypothetical protein